MLRRLLVAVACLSACSAVLVGCTTTEGTGDKSYVSADGQVQVLKPSERGAPVELTGEDLDGKQVDLADLRGGAVVVNVWGAWCTDCRVEQPDLNAAADELGDDATFLGINIRDSSIDNARAYVRNFKVPYASIYSPGSDALLSFKGTLTPRAIPATVVLDSEGRVAASILGRLPSRQTLIDLTRDVVAEDG